MLDIVASFAPVPEFTIKRSIVAERALLSHDRHDGVENLTSAVIPAIAMPECAKGGPAVKHLAALGGSAPSDAAEATHGQAFSALFSAAPAEALPAIPFAPQMDDVIKDDRAIASEPTLFHDLAPAEDANAQAAESRPVTPRRPMRFTFARDAGESAPIALPTPNLFDGIFQDDLLDSPDLDPRLRRSRERALARLAAYEAALPPEQRNLWIDDGADDAAPTTVHAQTAAQAAAPEARTESRLHLAHEPGHPRRVVRHLSVKRHDAGHTAQAPLIHDPLQDHLHRVRDALYTVDPEAEPIVQPEPALHRRILAIVMHLFLIIATLPDRLAEGLSRHLPSSRRGFDLRLAATASLVTACTVFCLQAHPFPLL